ncbi:CAF17-like 4Fe-4S cluster assembly/insertion protein YgfZ [Microbispora bryophytorum]|uniref:Folate-binding protein n=1 Tax=Microbispora bryophytorum TaxID=1460882 RepID=A0A8H9GXA0_9ACTN|nr:folate-binding protein YgfZ [Microbispora bryophytorum]MBD3139592.1 folate-binding protein YgfZ [Microbispora bryophytorum]TQS02882.1 folate-binding protein YgfZ [Microbispora bryophytorum]GGO02833.1 folate-binding protein [Microbispora bryophytorum]
MRSPLLDTSGAVAAQAPDETVAAHYGDPYAEQRALAGGRALVDRSNREVVRITGPDRLSWLNDLSSQKLDTLQPGTPTQTLLLDPQGRVEHHLALVDDGEAVWAHVEPGTSAELVAFLEKMRFMLRVEVADVTSDYAVVSLAPPSPDGGAEALGATVEGAVAVGGDLLVPRERLGGLPDALGLRPAGLWAYEALRIAAHVPRLGFETDHKAIPHEIGWIDVAVHMTKGCYRGQETVARVHNLGHPPRRLVFLHLDGSVDELPPHGAPVTLGVGTPVEAEPEAAVEGSAQPGQIGFVGSSARHYELGPIALAIVKRTVPVDIDLLAGGVAATQEIVVPPDAGRNVKIDPALRRRIR